MKLNLMHGFSICTIIRLEIRWRTHAGYCSILHVFSCKRRKGLRKYKKQIERDEGIAEELQDRNKSTEEQKVKIRKTIGTCRFIYNFYLAHNKELHESGKKFMSGRPV